MLFHHMALAVDGLGHRRGDAFHTHIVCGGSGVGEHSFHRLGGLPEQAVVDLDAVLEASTTSATTALAVAACPRPA